MMYRNLGGGSVQITIANVISITSGWGQGGIRFPEKSVM